MCASDRLFAPHPLRAGLLAATLCALAGCGSGAAPNSPEAAATAAGSPAAAPAVTADAPPAASRRANAGEANAAAPAGRAAIGTQLLSHPDDLQVVMLGYRLRGIVPPLAQWAEGQVVVQRANEFERAAVLQSERDRLQSIYDGTAGVGRLRLEVRSRFSEYDGGRGGYYFTAFAPGSGFQFSAQPASGMRERVGVQVDNEEELNFWPLDAATAQDVLSKDNGTRSVTLDSRFRITGASQDSGGTTIHVRLERYAIVSQRYQSPTVLGERVFEDAGE